MKKLHDNATAVLLTFSTLPECSVFSRVHFCSASVASVKLISWGPKAGGRADGKVVRPGSQPLNGISRVLNHRGTQRMSIRTTRFSRRTAPIWTWYGHHLARFSCELFAISHGVTAFVGVLLFTKNHRSEKWLYCRILAISNVDQNSKMF